MDGREKDLSKINAKNELAGIYTVRKMASRFKLQLFRRYNIKFSKMRNFTLDTP